MNIKKTYLIFCLIITGLTTSTTIFAEKSMTLQDCIELALTNSTKIAIQKTDINDKKIARRDAILTAFTPNIQGSTTAYYNFGRSIDPQTNTYFNQTSFYNNYSVSAGIELFNGFESVNNIKIANTTILISKSVEKQIEAEICLAVIEAYYNVVYYKRLADIYNQQFDIARGNLHLSQRQEELGQKSHSDVIQMEADLADIQYDYINTVNMYTDQLLSLSALMLWPYDEEPEIDTSLPVYNPYNIDENNIINFSLINNDNIKIAQWDFENAKRELKTAKWQLLPTISFYAGWSTSYYDYSRSATPNFGYQFSNNRGEYIQLSMTIPIYNRLQNHSNIQRKKNAMLKASAQLEQAFQDVEAEVRRAFRDCEGASAAYRQASHKSHLQEEAFRLNTRKFEQGLISALEYQTANNNYLKAKADEMNSLFKFIIKQAVIRYYNGEPYQYQNL